MIKISYEKEGDEYSRIVKIFMVIHFSSILGVVVGACLINITDEVLKICAIVCFILTVIGAFIYDSDYDY